MIIKCGKKEEEKILSYIGDNYPSCLYLYLDLIKYGFDSETIDVFIQLDNETIKAVLLRYFSCIHVFSKDNSFDEEELGGFFEDNVFSMIYCATKTANKLYPILPKSLMENATVTTGWVAQINKIDKEPNRLAVPVRKNDFDQIVRLIYDDEDIGRSYQYDDLARQLEERNREGYSRNIVIRQDNMVIAHACTNAEIGNIAVVAELIVRKGYRKKGYATEIWRDLCETLLSEGKEVYSFYFTDESRTLHRHVGFVEICDWTKIVIDKKGIII